MAYPGYGGYGGPMPGGPMPGGPTPGMPGMPGMPPQGMPGGPMGGPMPGPMGGPMGGAPPQGGYGSYGGYPGAYGTAAPAANDPMWGYFTAIAGQDGEVDAEELQRCLTQSGFTGSYTPFSLETCRIMIAMLDRDHTGKMGFNEFKELFAALNGWKQNFMMFDQDRSGTVEPHEMSQAINSMGCKTWLDSRLRGLDLPIRGGQIHSSRVEFKPGFTSYQAGNAFTKVNGTPGYRVSPPALNVIIKRYNRGGRIYFDDYVACCVKLRSLTENFRQRDTMHQGSVNFQYDDFILCTMAI
ncbi:Grancalcin [Takifugu flavidus]|uniref:Grancalcin n=1 Tax=Takifugu flavidus TaxID=433684 RepID=A0A5C6N950_9TELE|nr:Grancalcin [Takifugu flavidus]